MIKSCEPFEGVISECHNAYVLNITEEWEYDNRKYYRNYKRCAECDQQCAYTFKVYFSK